VTGTVDADKTGAMAVRLVLLALALTLAGCGGASHEPKLLVGAVDDAAKYAPDAAAQMKLARESGFRAVVLSAVWKPGASAATELPALRRAVDAAVDEDVRPVLAVYQFSSATPADAPSRRAFAAFAAGLAHGLPDVHDVIVGNEPNLNLFWQPQFDGAGGDAAAAAFEALLAETYDALKGVDESIQVIGAGLAPHGGDRPSSRPTHSPTRFIADLGAAYRASGRDRPLMDAISVHVYGESSRVPPWLAHPRATTIGVADYRKLVSMLGTAKASLYTGREPVTVVDEQTQARYYEYAIRTAARQPNVRMLFLFHVSDEPRLEGLQSGVRYADGSPKSSETLVRAAVDALPDR
jgi:hypothetical protein